MLRTVAITSLAVLLSLSAAAIARPTIVPLVQGKGVRTVLVVTVDDQQRNAISTELARIEEGAEYSSNSQFEQAKLWRGTNLVLGVPAAVLAAVAGATALASTAGRVAAGILALCAAGLGAVMTTLNAARRAEQAHVAGNAL